MCGFACSAHSQKSKSELHRAFNHVQYRGPDNSIPLTIDSIFMVFHRLAIMDLSAAGNQPFITTAHPNLVLICNGEIYNHQELITRYGFTVESESDCEVILHLIARVGLEKTVQELDGVYAFVVYDRANQVLHIGRDPFGVRPCFWGTDEDQALYVASEAKAIDSMVQQVQPFTPGTAATWCLQQRVFAQHITHHAYVYDVREEINEQQITEQIRARLTKAVQKRLMSHRELGCLLSGGLDSSLIAALVARHSTQRIKTFSIGLKDSVDLKFARIVADHIGSDHHEIELTEDQFLEAIPQVIHNIESYDTTTVRASVGNYLVSKFIRENSDCKVVFNGDGADEVCVGYLYNINAPTDQALQQEAIRLVRELHYFDVLRSDRSISSNGLEARTPFLDPDFVTYYMGIEPGLKRFDSNKMEKYLLRKAFDGTGLPS